MSRKPKRAPPPPFPSSIPTPTVAATTASRTTPATPSNPTYLKPTSTTHPLRNPPWLYVHLQPIIPPTLPTTSTNPTTTHTTTPSTAHDAQTSAHLDEPTLRLHLLSAMTSYLGDTGAAFPVDILRLSHPTHTHNPTRSPAPDALKNAHTSQSSGTKMHHQPQKQQHQIYIRVPYQDGPLFCAAITSWAGSAKDGIGIGIGGYRVLGRGPWLACLDTDHDGEYEEGGEGGLFDFAAG